MNGQMVGIYKGTAQRILQIPAWLKTQHDLQCLPRRFQAGFQGAWLGGRGADDGAQPGHGCRWRIGHQFGEFNEENRCIVLVSHDQRIAAFADRIFYLTDGKVVIQKSAE